MQCPTCDRQIDPKKSESLPFCSERCRQIDLVRWLGEKHALPTVPREEDEQEFDESAS